MNQWFIYPGSVQRGEGVIVAELEFTWFPGADEIEDDPGPEFAPVAVGRSDGDYTREEFLPEEFDEKYDVSLREYQERAVRAVFARWKAGDRGTGVEHATATGKTYVFAAVIARYERVFGRRPDGSPRRFLVLAHRDYLLDQAARTLVRFHVDSAIEMGRKKALSALFGDPTCVIASVQSMQANESTSRLLGWEPDYFDAIIIDEGHHALSPIYKRILNHFDYKHLLIVSGTFDRTDGRNLGEIIDSIADRYQLDQAVDDQWVCNVRVRWCKLAVDISHVKEAASRKNKCKDLNEADIAKAVEPYITEFANEIKAHIGSGEGGIQAILFAPSVEVSQYMADALTSIGIRSAHLHAKSKDRAEVLREYRAGFYQCLCNYGLFTEGYDLPSIGAVVIMRPTKSRALYCQMVGRGLRPSGTGDDLLLIDFPWVSGKHKLVKPAELFFSAGSRFTEEAIRHAERVLDIGDNDDILAAIKRADEDIKVRDRFRLEIREKKVKSKVIEYKPLDASDVARLPRHKEIEEPRLRPATIKQVDYLRSQGIPGAEAYSFVRAHIAISKLIARAREGKAPYWMVDELIQKHGYDRRVARQLKAETARRLIDECRAGRHPGELF